MNAFWKFALVFIGGAVVGAVGATTVSRHDGVRPLAADLLSRSMDAKDAVMGKVETLKENMEDLVAEAQNTAEKRKVKKEEAAG